MFPSPLELSLDSLANVPLVVHQDLGMKQFNRYPSVMSEKYVYKVAGPCRESNPHRRSIRRAWDSGCAGPDSRAWLFPTLEQQCDCLVGHSVRSLRRRVAPPG